MTTFKKLKPTGLLSYYNYFDKYYKMIAIDLSKQQALYVDPKAIQQLNFTGNLIRKKFFTRNC